MQESASPSDQSSGGVFLHDLSIRCGEQVLPLDALDLDEVLTASELQLSGSISGDGPGVSSLCITQSYRPFMSEKRVTIPVDASVHGRFRSELKLHNGANGLDISLVGSDGAILEKKHFLLYHKGSFREWNETIFIAFFLAIIIRGLVLQAFWIPTGSMEPTLHGEQRDPFTKQITQSGDRILVNRFAYVLDLSLDGRLPFGPRVWLKKPQRGDIIVFKYPDPDPTAAPKDYIKRVIGLEGDLIEIFNGVVAVNGKKLNEPYIAEPPISNFRTVVAKDSVFCMGDNRNNSADSRYWGPMPLKNLKGQAVFNYLPLGRLSPIRSYPGAITEESFLWPEF